MKKNQFQQRFEKDLKDNYFRYLSYLIALNIVSYYKYYQNYQKLSLETIIQISKDEYLLTSEEAELMMKKVKKILKEKFSLRILEEKNKLELEEI